MKAALAKPLTRMEQRRQYLAWRRQATAAEICLDYARGDYDYYLVRLPVRMRLGTSARRLADRAEEIATGRCWRIFVPESKTDATGRNFILRDQDRLGVRYVRALALALQELGLLDVAQLFIADTETGVLRRVLATH